MPLHCIQSFDTYLCIDDGFSLITQFFKFGKEEMKWNFSLTSVQTFFVSQDCALRRGTQIGEGRMPGMGGGREQSDPDPQSPCCNQENALCSPIFPIPIVTNVGSFSWM